MDMKESVQLKTDICEFVKTVWKKRNTGIVFLFFTEWNIFNALVHLLSVPQIMQ